MSTLTASRLRELLHYDPATGIFTRRVSVTLSKAFKVGDIAGGIDRSTGYVKISVDGRRYFAHRLAWLHVHGEWPKTGIDHRNRNGADNRIGNLREASKSANAHNATEAKCGSRSGLLGASWCKKQKRWQATITVNRRSRYLGRYATAEEAHAVYMSAKASMMPGCVQ